MKILIINKFYYLKGGSERYAFELAKLLENHGHKVISFSMQDEKNIKSKFSKYFIKNVNLEKFNIINIFKFFHNYEAVRKLEKLIKDEKPDIAHLHNIAHQLTPAIIKVLKKHKIPMVQTLHDYKLICPNAKLFSRGRVCEKCQGGKYYNCLLNNCLHNSKLKSFMGMLEAYLNNKIFKYYKEVNLFIAPSQFMKDVCVKFGVRENKIRVIYNFIDTDAYSKKKNTNSENEENYILYFGRLAEEKGIGSLLKAMTEINCDIKLKIVGEGPELFNFQFSIFNFQLNDRVELLGAKYGDELIEIVKNAKAVVIPSLWPENMPYSVLEALALGKIVIASNIGGLPEIINHGKNGLLFRAGDSKDLAEKINLIMSETEDNTFQIEAKNSLKRFDKKSHYQKIIQLYSQVINNFC